MGEDEEHFCVGCPGLKEKEKVHTRHSTPWPGHGTNAASTPGWLDAGCHGHVKKQCLLL